MRPAVVGVFVGILLVIFVTVWVYMASRGMLPSIGGQLENVDWPIRVLGLLVLVGVIGVAFSRTKKQ
jgi:hypothetical protein